MNNKVAIKSRQAKIEGCDNLINIYLKNDSFTRESDINSKEILITYDEFKDNQNCLHLWLEKSEIFQTIYDAYSAELYGEMFIEQKFLTLIQALEGYLRYKQKKKHGLETRLNMFCKCFSEAIDTIISPEIELKDIITSIKNSRDYLSHMNLNEIDKSAKLFELFKLGRFVKRLLEIAFLNEIGFTNEQINAMIKRSNVRYF